MTTKMTGEITHKKTLGLIGVTINAMALIAPGAFLWLMFPVQLVGSNQTNRFSQDIWPGIVVALGITFIASLSFGELARRYPHTNYRNAYQFADRVFAEQNSPRYARLERVAKLVTGWAAHLYYWVYPGVLVAFTVTVSDYLLHFLGYTPTVFGQILLACSYSAFIGFLALRGITGSTVSSIVLNTIQLVVVILFGGLAIAFRLLNPLTVAEQFWLHPTALSVISPHQVTGIMFQAGLAMILLVGFETSAALRAIPADPGRDNPRGSILALIIQGVFVYLFTYFAAGFALNAHNLVVTRANTPIGDLALQIGNSLLSGNGPAFMLVIAFVTIIALIATTLSAMNTGVRISFTMAMDDEMPDIMSLLHDKYATPYFAVVLITIVSAAVGSFGSVGGLTALMGIIIASNLGTFVLYAMICLLTVIACSGDASFRLLRQGVLPIIGVIGNSVLAAAVLMIGITSGGIVTQASYVGLAFAGGWFVLSTIYIVVSHKRRAHNSLI
ncbi:MAG: APC family permease [Anaerolineae bacterium]|nr:APC family permease [Anaerolineae bacterium]